MNTIEINSDQDGRIPIYLLTGFLGAGKTTLLNKAIKDRALARSAVIVNEFGAVGLDHFLIETEIESMVQLNGGCICCTAGGEFVETLLQIHQTRLGEFDRFIIELSGLSEPEPVLQSIIKHPILNRWLKIAGTICLFDAMQGKDLLEKHPEARHQLCVADRVLITKSDLVTQETRLFELEKLIKFHAPYAEICRTSDPHFDVIETFSAPYHIVKADRDSIHHTNHSQNGIQSVALKSDKPLQMSQLELFLDLLRSQHGQKILRLKAIVWTTDFPKTPVVVHGVGCVFHPPVFLPEWPENKPSTLIVVITKDLDPEIVRALFGGFIGEVRMDTPDIAAITDNPLKILGF